MPLIEADLLKEAKFLYDHGFAVHWIEQNKKKPVKGGWQNPGRDDWKELRRTYKPGYGLGVRLGQSSKIKQGYLANIDVDIKSDDPRHKKEALKALERHFPGISKSAPYVKTPKGYRFLIALKRPLPTEKLAVSSERVKTLMPSVEVSPEQADKWIAEGLLTKEEIQKGYRDRVAWEIEFMSEGKQGLLPPSVHPDTQTLYKWPKGLTSREVIKRIPFLSEDKIIGRKKEIGERIGTKDLPADFKFVDVDIFGRGLPEELITQIVEGTDAGGRSDLMLSVAMKLIRRGFTTNEIISILTDPDLGFSEACAEHTKSRHRTRHARWVYRYTVQKAEKTLSLENVFSTEIEAAPTLGSVAERDKQAAQLTMINHGEMWKNRLDRKAPTRLQTEMGAPGDLLPSIKNLILILEHEIGPDVFRFDRFTDRIVFGKKVPWLHISEIGAPVSEDRVYPNIIGWVGETYGLKYHTTEVNAVVERIAEKNAFDSALDWIESLPEWDGLPGIDTALSRYLGCQEKEEYLSEVLKLVMVALITRQYSPGSKFDSMLIIEGEKSLGKSTFIEKLFGRRFVHSNITTQIDSRDSLLSLRGKTCVFLDEFEKYNLQNSNGILKGLITRSTDTVRKMRVNDAHDFLRRFIITAAVNGDEYLTDPDNDRRYIIVVASNNRPSGGEFDSEGFEKEVPQLWAEAYHLYKTGYFKWLRLSPQNEIYANSLRNRKVISDESNFMVHKIKDFILMKLSLKPEDRKIDFADFSMVSLFDRELPGPLCDFDVGMKEQRLAGAALRALGAQKTRVAGRGNFRWMIETEPFIQELILKEKLEKELIEKKRKGLKVITGTKNELENQILANNGPL